MEIANSIEKKLNDLIKILQKDCSNLSNINIHENRVTDFLSNSLICLEQVEIIIKNYFPDNNMFLDILEYMRKQNSHLVKWITNFAFTGKNRQKDDDRNLSVMNNQCEICKNYIDGQKIKSIKNDIFRLPNLIHFSNKEINELLDEEKQELSFHNDFYGKAYFLYQKQISGLYAKTQSYIEQVLGQGKLKKDDEDELLLQLYHTNQDDFSDEKFNEMFRDLFQQLRKKMKKKIEQRIPLILKKRQDFLLSKYKLQIEQIQQKMEIKQECKKKSEKEQKPIEKTSTETIFNRFRNSQEKIDQSIFWKEKYLSLVKQIKQSKQRTQRQFAVTSDSQFQNPSHDFSITQKSQEKSKEPFFPKNQEENKKQGEQMQKRSRSKKFIQVKKTNPSHSRAIEKVPTIETGIQCELLENNFQGKNIRKKSKFLLQDNDPFFDSTFHPQTDDKFDKKDKTNFKLMKDHKNSLKSRSNKKIKLEDKKTDRNNQFQLGKKNISHENMKLKNRRSKQLTQHQKFIQRIPKLQQKQIQSMHSKMTNGQANIYESSGSLLDLKKRMKNYKTEENQVTKRSFDFKLGDPLNYKPESIIESKLDSIIQERKKKILNPVSFSIKRQDFFGTEDFQLLGGFSECYKNDHSIVTRSHFSQLTDNEQELMNSIVSHIEGLASFKIDLYANTISFLLKPYSTVENRKIYCEKKMDKKTLESLIGSIIERHKKSCGEVECKHMKTFMDKILFQQV